MASCFGEDKNEVLDQFACDPSGKIKSCCSRGDSCASNGLCVTSNKDTLSPYFVNSCTEENWDDPTCITECRGNGNGVSPCGAGKFCCYGFGGCDCNNSTQVFTLDPVKIITTIPTDATKVDEASSATSDITSATGSSTGSTVTHTNTSAAETTSSSSDGSSSNNALPIGLGVGIGAGVVLIGLGVGFWLWKRKKSRASRPAVVSDDYMHKPPVENHNPPNYGHYQPVKPVEMSANTDRVELP
ncbi:hypothetical protein FSST1_009657 [Fusarium sambucinum]